jgi:NTP pyrophosphatase (non-canonical NTP hydrolase)
VGLQPATNFFIYERKLIMIDFEQPLVSDSDFAEVFNAFLNEPSNFTPSLNMLSRLIHQRNVDAGWWTDLETGEDLRGYKPGYEGVFSKANRDVLNLLCLVHSEVSEAAEGVRKNLMDDKLPHRTMLEVELADTFIRIFDIAGAHNLDLGGAVLEKLEFNAARADHKIENRLAPDGKKF